MRPISFISSYQFWRFTIAPAAAVVVCHDYCRVHLNLLACTLLSRPISPWSRLGAICLLQVCDVNTSESCTLTILDDSGFVRYALRRSNRASRAWFVRICCFPSTMTPPPPPPPLPPPLIIMWKYHIFPKCTFWTRAMFANSIKQTFDVLVFTDWRIT